jgi:hypothetical protein
MSRKFAIVSLSGAIDNSKVFELGFSGYPIIASDGVERSNSHYLYEPKFIGSVNDKGEHFGYMFVDSFKDGVIIAVSKFGMHEFVEII